MAETGLGIISGVSNDAFAAPSSSKGLGEYSEADLNKRGGKLAIATWRGPAVPRRQRVNDLIRKINISMKEEEKTVNRWLKPRGDKTTNDMEMSATRRIETENSDGLKKVESSSLLLN